MTEKMISRALHIHEDLGGTLDELVDKVAKWIEKCGGGAEVDYSLWSDEGPQINYKSPETPDERDRRLTREARRAEETEINERATLAKLKDKYEVPK